MPERAEADRPRTYYLNLPKRFLAGVVVDQSPLKQVYDPKHPMADAQGYISMPNVDPIAETVNMICLLYTSVAQGGALYRLAGVDPVGRGHADHRVGIGDDARGQGHQVAVARRQIGGRQGLARRDHARCHIVVAVSLIHISGRRNQSAGRAGQCRRAA